MTLYIIHRDLGLDREPPKVYRSEIDRRNRVSRSTELYVSGRDKPNYPVPAIRPYGDMHGMNMFQYLMWHGWLHAQRYQTKP
jgi:hypothetical protein